MSEKCSKCGEMLTEPGWIAFSSPLRILSNIAMVVKIHICKSCWSELLKWLSEDPSEKGKERHYDWN